jgi:hypothetical protein
VTLTALIHDVLPPEWRDRVRVEPIAGGFRARFCDREGREHAIEARRSPERCLVRGPALGYSYASRPYADVAKYRAVFDLLVQREGAIVPLLDAPAAPPEPMIFVRESELREPIDVPDRAHVYLYFEARCEQSCQFCQEPHERVLEANRARHLALVDRHAHGTDFVGSGGLDRLLHTLAAKGGALTIHGHDWAQHPRLDALLDRLIREERVPIALLGPSTRLNDPSIAARVGSIKTLRRLTLTLLSADPSRHDEIAGAPGAGVNVLAAIAQLRASGVEPIVNVVLTADVVRALPDLIVYLDREHLRAALLGFVPDRGPASLAHLFAHVADIRAALEGDPALRVVESAAGLPLCALPRPLHTRASMVWPSTDRPGFVYPSACDTCADKHACAGVPREYSERFGASGTVPREA